MIKITKRFNEEIINGVYCYERMINNNLYWFATGRRAIVVKKDTTLWHVIGKS